MATRKHEIERRLLDPQFTGSLEPDTESPILLARRIVAKEKRRLCVLTIATCLAWVAATSAGVGVAAFYFNGVMHNMPFYEYRYAKAHEVMEEKRGQQLTPEEFEAIGDGARAVERVNDTMLMLTQTTFVLFGVAALLSIWLVIASRRCTLKQINANLASLSSDLRAMLGASEASA